MELLELLDTTTAIIMLGMITGVTEFVKALIGKDWHAAIVIAAAAAAGALTALPLGVNPLIGAVVGFAASGYVTIAQNVGKSV